MGGRKKPLQVQPGACAFCRDKTNDEMKFGKFLHQEDMSIHEKCLFFSSGLQQTHHEDMEICGFTLDNIKKELARGTKLKCAYCKANRATIGCSIQECRKSFHYPCGLKHYALFQHFDSFQAFCREHKPTQKKIKPSANEFVCRICFASLKNEISDNYLYTTCCKNNWFHRSCLEEYAFNAGSYFFKCPMCNDSDVFSKEMMHQGIYVPIKDASWELEENAFGDLLIRPECDATPCKCKRGTSFSGTGAWDLLNCRMCGSQARHKACAGLKDGVSSWTCKDCASLLSECQAPAIRALEDRVSSVSLEDSPVYSTK